MGWPTDGFPGIVGHCSDFEVVFTKRGQIQLSHKAILHMNYNCSSTISRTHMHPTYDYLCSMRVMLSELERNV